MANAHSDEDAAPIPMGAPLPGPRVDWVDLAKGWCIILVVSMHSALGVGVDLDATGWLHAVVAFAKPFRMPDFFMIAGLFVGSAIASSWRNYIDRKVLHFVYFYALWLAIVLAVKSHQLGISTPAQFVGAYAENLLEPFSTLWFIQLLPILFVAIRLVRDAKIWMVIAFATALHLVAASFPAGGDYAMASIWTGWTTLDSFALFFVYFYAGHVARNRIFQIAERAVLRPAVTLVLLAVWALMEGLAVHLGYVEIPGVTLLAGFSGAIAVVATSSLLASWRLARWLAYCGRHSLIIYLSFVLPMAAARVILLRSGIVESVGWSSAIVSLVAIVAPLALAAMTKDTALVFLFTRPRWAHLPRRALDRSPSNRRPAPFTTRSSSPS